ncbi:MAG: site-specific integrase [Methylococcaceae bacterium]|nr:site-specific integrase [Methylococcaceae bacterium]
MALKFALLTRDACRKAKPGETIIEHGISFERTANGDARWKINIMVDGQRVHRVIGMESAGVTREQAENVIEKLRTEAREGRLNLPKGRKVALGFQQAAAKYLEKSKEEGGKNLAKKAQHIRDHLGPFFGSKPLAKIAGFDVERYKKARLEAGITPGTLNRELATLSHLLTKAVDWKWIDHKSAHIKRAREQAGRITYLTIDQAARLLEAARFDQSPDVYPFIVIGLETSMRRMEILSIRLENIDLARRVIFIPQAKAGAREQPITAGLADFLREYVETAESGQVWLFPSKTSASGHVMNIEKQFRRVVTAAGMDPKEIVRHTLRHTAITHLVQAGVDLPTVQRISGHKTLQMVVRYAHQNGEHIGAAMDKLEDRYHSAKPKATTVLPITIARK